MKNLILVCCFLITNSFAFSQFLEEDFNYPEGDSIGAHGWTSFSGGATNRIMVTSPGLSFPEYPKSAIGNATTILSTGQDAYKTFTSTQNSGSLYASFMINIDTARSSGDYFCAFRPPTSTTGFFGRCYLRKTSNGNYAFGISKTTAAAGGIFYGDSVFSAGVTYLLALKYTFNSGSTTDDEVSLIVMTSGIPVLEPPPYAGPVSGTATDPSELSRFSLRQGTAASSPEVIIDGIAIAKAWNTVLPVEMENFSASVSARSVSLFWTIKSQVNNSGFEIQRADGNNFNWEKIGFVNGSGNSNQLINYTYTDRSVNSGIYNYRLKQTDFNGNYQYYFLNNEVVIGRPSEFSLSQNYPNPFNPSTTINYDVPKNADVKLILYNVSGKSVMTLVDNNQSPGYYSVKLNANDLASGIYFYTLTAEDFTETKSLMLLK